jgi:hypothetical protein
MLCNDREFMDIINFVKKENCPLNSGPAILSWNVAEGTSVNVSNYWTFSRSEPERIIVCVGTGRARRGEKEKKKKIRELGISRKQLQLKLKQEIKETTVLCTHRLSQEERPVFWEVIVSVILSKKLCMYTCPVPNSFRDRAILLYTTPYSVQASNTPCPHTSC